MPRARYEHKYLIGEYKYLSLKKVIESIVGSGRGEFPSYPVCSLYYDTPSNEYFYQKINGEYRHVKVRLRKYSKNFFENSPAWLETKTKIKDRIVKERSRVESVDAIPVPSQWDDKDRSDLWIQRAMHKISPSCFILYDREAFEFDYKGEKLRITFDHDMAVFSPDQSADQALRILDRSHGKKILMEIKYFQESYPLFLQDLLHKFSLKRVYFSKYAEGLNVLKRLL